MDSISLRLPFEILKKCKKLSEKNHSGRYQSFIKQLIEEGVEDTIQTGIVLKNVPNEVYFVASEYEGFDTPELENAKRDYFIDCDLKGVTNGGFEKAISDYLHRIHDFGCDGKFAECSDNGYSCK